MSMWPNPYQQQRTQPWEMPGVLNPAVSRFFNAVYAWMCVGLAITAAVAWYVAQYTTVPATLGSGVWLLFLVEVVLVMTIITAVQRITAGMATLLFILYAAINGVVFSSLFLLYAHAMLVNAFLITAGTFGALSVFGMVTKINLSGVGRIAIMALIGVIIASVVSYFWHNSLLEVAINYVGVLVFVALTARDTQKLKQIAVQTENNAALAARMSIVGSLVLYLDFINLFLFILSIMGDRRR
jgi:hypothetical protein